jgi:hypothetical protein
VPIIRPRGAGHHHTPVLFLSRVERGSMTEDQSAIVEYPIHGKLRDLASDDPYMYERMEEWYGYSPDYVDRALAGKEELEPRFVGELINVLNVDDEVRSSIALSFMDYHIRER